MVLRRGDWETGDVICHECHLIAPPPPHLLPICLLSHILPFLVSQVPLLLPQLCLSPLFFFHLDTIFHLFSPTSDA